MFSELVDAPLVAAIAAVLLLPIARRVRRRWCDPFEPIVLFAATDGVIYANTTSSYGLSNVPTSTAGNPIGN